MMERVVFGFLPVAESILEDISRGATRHAVRSRSIEWIYFLLGIVVLIVILHFVGRLARRGQTENPNDRPWRLFWSLCSAHELNWSDRWLLWRVVQALGLAEPATIFLDPRRLDSIRCEPMFRSRNDQIVRLGRHLFAGIEKDPGKMDDPRLPNPPPERAESFLRGANDGPPDDNPSGMPWEGPEGSAAERPPKTHTPLPPGILPSMDVGPWTNSGNTSGAS